MKNYIIPLFWLLVSVSLFSQNDCYSKFADAEILSLPYTDNTEFTTENTLRITEADWLNFGFDVLEEYDSDFQYSVYGTVEISGYKILMINRTYREERNHWAVYISNDGRILSHVNIAYKNSEGSLYIESELSPEKIIVKETNYYSETPTESEKHFYLTETGFEEK